MNPQLQSPLFGVIPAEIRNEIFDLALQWYDDPEKLYVDSWVAGYCSRPGFRGSKKIDAALLRTCKKVYEETKAIPLRDLELAYYLGYSRRAPTGFQPYPHHKHHVFEDPKADKLWIQQLIKVSHARIFAQMYAFGADPIYGCIFRGKQTISPTTVTITIRYTDWWNWESNAPLSVSSLRPSLAEIFFPFSVEKLVMELETRDGKKKELERVIVEMRGWEYNRDDEEALKMAEDEPVKEWTWDGPTAFENGTIYHHHPTGDTMKYVVKVLTWRARKSSVRPLNEVDLKKRRIKRGSARWGFPRPLRNEHHEQSGF
ncbi:hypothetical protein P154DRAFT_534442 [Amniculicola lignicola CBS 123094]|uniref:Uncharacterized protein n=1 Tax=Amniculicola lignicola CBS 123094 TaxID=1392246 RepID=A0A6A5WFI6_9PLEO|nr:hypothetical protein P154DRAFT_534442 [Amniculicola lignicola CBS 123094]